MATQDKIFDDNNDDQGLASNALTACTPEWFMFMDHINKTLTAKEIPDNMRAGAFRLIKATLEKMYNTNNPTKLMDAGGNPRTQILLNETLSTVALEDFEWKKTTSHRMFVYVRKMLGKTSMGHDVVKNLRLSVPVSEYAHPIIPQKYTDPKIRLLLESWILKIKQTSRMKSNLGIRILLNFCVRLVTEHLGLELRDVENNEQLHKVLDDNLNRAFIDKVCGTHNNMLQNATKLRDVLYNVLEYPHTVITDEIWYDMSTVVSSQKQEDDALDDGSDHHRITSDDLQTIHGTVNDTFRNKLFFEMLIRTGMRVGGLVNIKVSNVAIAPGNGCSKWTIRKIGSTIEKGAKCFQFPIGADLGQLIIEWLTKHRPLQDSPFLFPGSSGTPHIATSTVRASFKALCKKGGLEGKQFHPHALRHTYAHILLESGATPYEVSKYMGHSDASTTERFYLKENISEVMKRVKVPWLTDDDRKEEVKAPPAFLQRGEHSKKKKRKREEKKNTLDSIKEQLLAMEKKYKHVKNAQQ